MGGVASNPLASFQKASSFLPQAQAQTQSPFVPGQPSFPNPFSAGQKQPTSMTQARK